MTMDKQNVSSSNSKSPAKQKVTCKGCRKRVQLLLSHLERTTKPCKALYDMEALRAEATRLHKEQMASRNRELYHNDPDASQRKRAASKEYYKKHTPEKKAASKEYYKKHTPEKKAASKEYYKKHTPEKKAASKKLYLESPEKKKEAMTAYNENHREEINFAMQELYVQSTAKSWTEFACPVCFDPEKEHGYLSKKSLDRHMEHAHTENQKTWTCQICDKAMDYKESLDRHMKEVHGGVKHSCDQCPASFSRKRDFVKHQDSDWHYLRYHCPVCFKDLVFKNLGGLIEHIIVKRSEGEEELDGHKWKIYKSGILLDCKSRDGSIQLEDGEHILCMPRKEQVEAEQKRLKEKEGIINGGLSLSRRVKLEFIREKHEENFKKSHCKWCEKRIPFSDEYCSVRFRAVWKIHVNK